MLWQLNPDSAALLRHIALNLFQNGIVQHSICRSLALSGAAAMSLGVLPAHAEPTKLAQGTAAELGVMDSP